MTIKRRKPLPRQSKPIARKTRVKPVNRARRSSEFQRAYGSRNRVAWVKSLPCAGCGVEGHSENAHVASGGAGRKADASQVVPLCAPHWQSESFFWEGCHRELHRVGKVAFEMKHGIHLDIEAEMVDEQWDAMVAGNAA